MWAVKNSQKRRSARSEGEKSAGVAAWRAGGGGRSGPSTGTKSGNMVRECTPILVVHKGRYVAYMKAAPFIRPSALETPVQRRSASCQRVAHTPARICSPSRKRESASTWSRRAAVPVESPPRGRATGRPPRPTGSNPPARARGYAAARSAPARRRRPQRLLCDGAARPSNRPGPVRYSL